MTERVLLAGCGDLGMRVAHRLLARGVEVWALRRNIPLPSDHTDLTNETHRIHWIQGDLTQAHTLGQLPKGITQVAYMPTPDSRTPDAYRAIFKEGLITLLNALDPSHLKKIVFVSSTAVYGEHHGEWIDEQTPPNPHGFNGQILLETERWLTQHLTPSVCLRLTGIYGPGRQQLAERLRAGVARAPLHPVHWANRIHIDDAAAAVDHVLALDHPAPVYVASDSTPLPLHTLYTHIADLIGAPHPQEGPAPAHVGSKKISNARLVASGWTPQWPDSREGYAALLQTN